MIVEGVLLLEALATIERVPDFLVFLEKEAPHRPRDRSLDDDLTPENFVSAIKFLGILSGAIHRCAQISSWFGRKPQPADRTGARSSLN
jgi:hypothetical protein